MKTPTHCLARIKNRGLAHATFQPAILGLLLAAATAPAGAAPKRAIPFSDARIRIEINDTAGDSGLHLNLDAEGWKFVNLFDPSGNLVFHVGAGGGVRKTGLTELFFESAEPGFKILPLDEFLVRFPEGEYLVTGETITGRRLRSKAVLTHALPKAPVLLTPAKDSVQDPNNTVIRWTAVPDPKGSRIVRYEVIVAEEGAAPKRVLDATVPATVTSMLVPPTFLLRNMPYKYEVLAIEEGGNQTLREQTFRTAP